MRLLDMDPETQRRLNEEVARLIETDFEKLYPEWNGLYTADPGSFENTGDFAAYKEPETQSNIILAKLARLDEEVARLIVFGNAFCQPGWLLESSRELLAELEVPLRAYMDGRIIRRGQLYSQYLEALQGEASK